ncbi:MAG: glucosylceramidase [Muribaculaceae bacterium]|nr:glucosylceramidase [Muribaculaceae bacterium]
MKSFKIFPVIVLGIAGVANSGAQSVDFTNPSIKAETEETPAEVRYYIASDNGQHKLSEKTLGFETSTSGSVSGTITLLPQTKYQDIDGFGFGITGSTCYNLMKMSADDRKALLTDVFSPTLGYGCSYVRVPIGCSDFSLREYTCCDTPGIENFALTDEETKYIIPVMQEILKINPDVKIISTPWTAPLWMKNNGQWTGGNLKSENYDDYALYFVKWIQAMKANGIPIHAVTPQNEPLNWGNSASMYMSWTEQRDFIKKALGPKLRSECPEVKLYAYDHNYNYDNKSEEQHYPLKIYQDKEAGQYVAGAAYHNYGGDASEMTYIHDQAPEKELLFTEWTAGAWSSPGVGMEAITTDSWPIIYAVMFNWGRGAIVWNLLLDSDNGPNRPGGCVNGNGAIDVAKSDFKSLTYNSFYYVICAASAAVGPDSKRIGTTGTINKIDCIAFENGDGYSTMLRNTSSEEKKIRIKEGNRSFVATVPANSIATYRW